MKYPILAALSFSMISTCAFAAEYCRDSAKAGGKAIAMLNNSAIQLSSVRSALLPNAPGTTENAVVETWKVDYTFGANTPYPHTDSYIVVAGTQDPDLGCIIQSVKMDLSE